VSAPIYSIAISEDNYGNITDVSKLGKKGNHITSNSQWKLAALIPNLEVRSHASKVECWTKTKNYFSRTGTPTESVGWVYPPKQTVERY
jgi:hypothetical protein